MTDDGDEILALVDANSGDTPYPYLVWAEHVGTLVIANDYETVNDETAREFTITPQDAIKLATWLLIWAIKRGH